MNQETIIYIPSINLSKNHWGEVDHRIKVISASFYFIQTSYNQLNLDLKE